MERIAIVGIGCHFPGGAKDAESFWSLLGDGRCGIGEIPRDRWSLEGFFDARSDLSNRSYSKWGGFLDDIKSFDASYFGLSPREAEAIDPQQRLLLMAAREAIFDARLSLGDIRRAQAGVFIGVSNIDYSLVQRFRVGHGERYAGTGTALSIVANRVSNRLDLSGPSMGIDTACSSSLVAVDTACRHLSDGTCGIALAGGVNILFDPRMFITFSRAHMLSPTGKIRAFDAAADGFVRGEGVGVVVLRRLDEAIAVGDRIYAVIEGTAVNQDGRTGAITEPNLTSQIAMMRSIAEQTGIDEAALDYVEAHGTGTFVGDPIEANAIGSVFGGAKRRAPLPVGSVKTNIGHLEPAAGIAGLIKTALILHNREIPASLGFETPNPAIDFDGIGIRVVDKAIRLRDDGSKFHAMVNSFGFGGTNACAMLGSAPNDVQSFGRAAASARVVSGADSDVVHPVAVPLSAPSAQHLKGVAACIAEAANEGGSFEGHCLRDIAGAIAAQQDHGEHRAVIIASDIEGFRARLQCLAEGRQWPAADKHSPPEIISGRAKDRPRIVFTMTGQGGQFWSMGRELIAKEPIFRQSIEAFDAIFKKIGGWSVIEILLSDEETSTIHDAAITPAVMFAFQTGLAEIWRARGVLPDIVLGHSFGEVTAAYLAGGIDQTAVAGLVTHRGLIRSAVDRVGTMAAIGLGADVIEPMLPADGSIEIGGYNSPQMVTLTGEESSIDALIERLNVDDPTILTRKLALDFAYHSSWFTPVEQIFKDDVGVLETAPSKLPVISTVTGDLNDRFDADYWWQNLRYPVRYQQAVERALELGGDTFVELGPHRTLSSMTAACAAGKGQTVTTVSALDKRWGDLVSLSVASGQLYVAGVDVDWSAVHGGGRRDIAVPRQPWVLNEYWSEPEEAGAAMRPAEIFPLLGRRVAGPAASWLSEVSLDTHAYLGDHRLDGECVFPAAAYLDMMVTAAREVTGSETVELSGVSFLAALYISADDAVQLRTEFDADRRRLTISSRLRDDAGDWQVRTQARVFPLQDGGSKSIEISLAEGAPKDASEFYRTAESNGFGWGRQFQGLYEISTVLEAATGRIRVSEGRGVAGSAFALDPRALDSALQLMLACDPDEGSEGMIPAHIERIRVHSSLPEECNARVQLRADSGDVVATVEIASPEGDSIITIEGLRAKRNRRIANFDRASAGQLQFYGEVFEAVETEELDEVKEGTWLLFGADGSENCRKLVDGLKTFGLAVDFQAVSDEAAAVAATYSEAFRDCFSRTPVTGIVYAVALKESGSGAQEVAVSAEREAIRATAFAQAISELAGDEPLPKVTVVTHGARIASSLDQITEAGLAQTSLIGLSRTVAMELPEISLQLVDIDDDALLATRPLASVLQSSARETEIAIRSGEVRVSRLREIPDEELEPSRISVSKLGAARNFRLCHYGLPGAGGLRWRQAGVPPPGPDEVTIEVRAVGLNFRDVMAVSGLLPESAEPSPAIDALGLELSGVVVACGEQVEGVEVGDAVAGMGRGALQRCVTWPAVAVRRLPKGLTHDEAATLPSAFLTAHYALNHVGRLQKGDCVLIHSASGGLGLAVVALARRAGARIIATAGSEEKRDYLRRIGIEDVFDSRSLEFADDVMAVTAGRGVDVVVNSLGGDFIAKSLACLAPYGRFLELGKRDVYSDSSLGLGSLRSNISFNVIDVAALIAERTRHASVMLGEIFAMIDAGEVSPLPITTFGASRISDAFQLMAEARHIGKVVVGMDDPDLFVESALADGAPFDPNGTYLVAGGVAGFGRAVGELLVNRGAGRVVLASRGAVTNKGDAGNVIETLRLDVTDEAAVREAVSRLVQSDKPLRGIVHAAVVYDDALLAQMDPDRVSRVLAPKIDGVVNLTRGVESAGAGLDFFASFSSLAQVVGWPGQSNYTAANSFLDGMAHWQRSRGIPGTCINWGALDESGHVARSEKMQSYLSSAGWAGINNVTALTGFARALDCSEASIAIPSVDWKKLTAVHPVLARSKRTSHLSTGGQLAGDPTSRELMGLKGEELQSAVLQLVTKEAAKVLRVGPDDIASAITLNEAGIDSLSSFELRLRIEQQLRLEVPLARYARSSRFEDLAALCRALVEEARHRRHDAEGGHQKGESDVLA